MEKEIIYRAYDGEAFVSEEACLEHEKKTTFKMYSGRGKPVYSTDGATLVNLYRPNGGADFFSTLYNGR